MKTLLLLFLSLTAFTKAKTNIRIVLLAEKYQPEVSGWFRDSVRDAETKFKNLARISEDLILLDRENEDESFDKLCASAFNGVSLLLEFTWSEWEMAKNLTDQWNVPHIKTQTGSAILVLEAVLELLGARNATDAVLIFQTEKDLDQSLYNIIGTSVLRVMVVNGLKPRQAENIKKMRPTPGNFVVIGDTAFVQDVYKLAKKVDLTQLSERWILAFTDLNYGTFDTSVLEPSTSLLSIKKSTGCHLQDLKDECHIDKDFQIQFSFVSKMVEILLSTFIELGSTQSIEPVKINCRNNETSINMESTNKAKLSGLLKKSTGSNDSILSWDGIRNRLSLRSINFVQVGDKKSLEDVAIWSSNEPFKTLPGTNIKPLRTFYRIGTTPATPWTYPKIDPDTGNPILNDAGEPVYEGYCIEFIKKLSEVLDFDYEIVTPREGGFGRKLPDGNWTGIVGDLVRGETDIAVAATIMTSEREEVIDFVAPYFEQTGISIVMRKPIRKTSLFKFMTVLRVEVWLSIVAAFTLTAILLSLLDRYSPYSARNNKSAYPYPCRDFTLKESFWFALTSFTPQGGGEAPKALSGRTLVAAYWLFVVLMLATFTANLAAFLTVERMQTPVSSLEQLARQSRINYTVIEASMAHTYFINMKHAEDTLYRVWKEITLNSSSDETIYQVWDYPIREQYGHILLAINASMPLATVKEGFDKVNENIDADFALIHDSSEIKYEVSRNCNLTEVGEIFGERPFAIAVQQGARIADELSKAILNLQKERFFETMTAKYWNSSAKGVCDDSDESEGITLESLGGVFIATLFGLALAMVTLVWEIIYYKRKEKKIAMNTESPKIKTKFGATKAAEIFKKKKSKDILKGKTITIGNTFRPAIEKTKPVVSHINVNPKIAWNP